MSLSRMSKRERHLRKERARRDAKNERVHARIAQDRMRVVRMADPKPTKERRKFLDRLRGALSGGWFRKEKTR